MSIKPSHFRKMITDTLNAFDPKMFSPAALELLMLTAAHESYLGRYLYQNNRQFGPAVGFYQIEPLTHKSIFVTFFKHRYPDFQMGAGHRLLDPVYSTIVARGIYADFAESLPRSDDCLGLAQYYKKYWNTELGNAKIEDVMANYKAYAF